jgi:branched-chain amino acid transport system ATP-binding protein
LAPALVRAGILDMPEGRQLFRADGAQNLRLGAYTRRDAPGDRGGFAARVRISAPGGARRPASGHAQRRRAADAGNRPRADGQPRLLLLDDHRWAGAAAIKEIFQIIAEIRAAGTTVLLVEQNVHMALAVADYGYLLESGRIVLAGSSAALRERKEVQHAYLGQ